MSFRATQAYADPQQTFQLCILILSQFQYRLTNARSHRHKLKCNRSQSTQHTQQAQFTLYPSHIDCLVHPLTCAVNAHCTHGRQQPYGFDQTRAPSTTLYIFNRPRQQLTRAMLFLRSLASPEIISCWKLAYSYTVHSSYIDIILIYSIGSREVLRG